MPSQSPNCSLQSFALVGSRPQSAANAGGIQAHGQKHPELLDHEQKLIKSCCFRGGLPGRTSARHVEHQSLRGSQQIGAALSSRNPSLEASRLTRHLPACTGTIGLTSAARCPVWVVVNYRKPQPKARHLNSFMSPPGQQNR